MKYFPAFVRLNDRPCLVVGGGEVALKKARLLLRAGGRVHVWADEISEAFKREFLAQEAGGDVTYLKGSFAADLVAGYDVVIAASGRATLDKRVAAAAVEFGRPVNVVDRTDLCTFIMPSIVQRGDVLIGISTSGTSPVLARRIRGQIEAVLPARLGELAEFAQRFRQAVKSKFKWEDRRRFWDLFFDSSIARDVLDGRQSSAQEQMLSLVNRGLPESERGGMVHIVGTGPGDPDLLTLRALQVMQQADVVLYDKLVGPDVLDYVRREAELINVGKSRAHHLRTQDEINDLMVEHACAGRRVVRLKGGDPFVFGRGGEELDFLECHGISAQIVPGITAAIGCASAARIPLTHRQVSTAVTFVTGHGEHGEPDLDWESLVRLGQTLVIYMGVNTAGRTSRRLIDHGLSPLTPVAVIENGTLAAQKVVRGAVSELQALIDQHNVEGPAVLIIGAVAAEANEQSLTALAQDEVRKIA